MNLEAARYTQQRILLVCAILDELFSKLKEAESPEELRRIQMVFGDVIADLDLKILAKLQKQYPALYFEDPAMQPAGKSAS
jgi:hypothetical protein